MKSIELFSGAGGLALGIHLAGFQHRLLVEADAHAFETLNQNCKKEAVAGIRDWPLAHSNVEAVALNSFTDVDLLAAGIPCQPFSNGGWRLGLEDDRNMFPIFAKAVETVRPRAFLIENVNGLLHGRLAEHVAYAILQLSYPWHSPMANQTWREHLHELRMVPSDLPYQEASYTVNFQVLNAADYGVPQIRKRVFIVGFRRDLEVNWSFPLPTHSRQALLIDQWETGNYWARHDVRPRESLKPNINSQRLLHADGTNAWRTVRDAIKDLPIPRCADSLSMQHVLIPGARSYRGHTGSDIDSTAKSLKAGVHGVGGGENMLRQPNRRPRYLTVRESARLQTFPDSWSFQGTWSSVTRQLGNAVPVLLATVLGVQIKEALEAARAPRDAVRKAAASP